MAAGIWSGIYQGYQDAEKVKREDGDRQERRDLIAQEREDKLKMFQQERLDKFATNTLESFKTYKGSGVTRSGPADQDTPGSQSFNFGVLKGFGLKDEQILAIDGMGKGASTKVIETLAKYADPDNPYTEAEINQITESIVVGDRVDIDPEELLAAQGITKDQFDPITWKDILLKGRQNLVREPEVASVYSGRSTPLSNEDVFKEVKPVVEGLSGLLTVKLGKEPPESTLRAEIAMAKDKLEKGDPTKALEVFSDEEVVAFYSRIERQNPRVFGADSDVFLGTLEPFKQRYQDILAGNSTAVSDPPEGTGAPSAQELAFLDLNLDNEVVVRKFIELYGEEEYKKILEARNQVTPNQVPLELGGLN